MPRVKRDLTVVAVDEAAPPVLRAAGKRLPSRADLAKPARQGREWQSRAWEFYDLIGEYRYGCDWVGAMLSKASLFIAKNGERVTDGPVADYAASLFGGPDQQSSFLREIGIHITVAGEAYAVGTVKNGIERWQIVSASELTTRSGNFYVSGNQIVSEGNPLIIRLWRPHPRRHREANSPSRAILPILAELDVLTKRIFAEIDSRLAGAGLLFLPSELTLPANAVATTQADGSVATSGPGVSSADRVQEALQVAMTTAIGDQADPSAVVPIVITAPRDQIENGIKHVTFWSELDAVSIQLRTEAIRRLALGLDMPPEVLTGTADLSHWNAWALEESGIKAHIEPTLALITESLTEGYLIPLLLDDGIDPTEAAAYTVEADTSELRLRPNRSKEAMELWDRLALSTSALLRETGFNDRDDVPADTETIGRFLQKVASGSTTPELVEAALRALGVPLGQVVPTAPTTQARPTPSLQDHPVTGPPQVTITGPDGDGNPPAGMGLSPQIVTAAEVMVHRALERAGNRLRNRLGRKLDGVPAAETYLHVPVSAGPQLDYMLDDAFSGIDRYSICQQIDSYQLAQCLDTYCRKIIVDRSPVNVDDIAAYVAVAWDASLLQEVGV